MNKKLKPSNIEKFDIDTQEIIVARNTVALEHAVRSRGRFLRNYVSAVGLAGLATGSLITGALWAFWEGAHTGGVVVGGQTFFPALWSGLSASGQAIVALFIIFTFALSMGFITWILVNKHEQVRDELELAIDEVEDDMIMEHLNHKIKAIHQGLENHLMEHKATAVQPV